MILGQDRVEHHHLLSCLLLIDDLSCPCRCQQLDIYHAILLRSYFRKYDTEEPPTFDDGDHTEHYRQKHVKDDPQHLEERFYRCVWRALWCCTYYGCVGLTLRSGCPGCQSSLFGAGRGGGEGGGCQWQCDHVSYLS